ncbi:MAG: hypothetical protein AAFX81_06240 [Pseudomonadota bacterium]
MKPYVIVHPLIAVVGLLLLPSGASAQSGQACEGFQITAIGEGRVVSYHQAGPEGEGPGDFRPGVRNLVDAEGNGVGTLRWYEISISPVGDPQGNVASALRYYWVLHDGMLLGETLNFAPADRSDTSNVPIENDTLVILGGTGAYSGARGTIEQQVGVDGDPLKVTYDVEFVC